MHFDNLEDLMHGIDTLQHYRVPICEVCTPVIVPAIAEKLRIKQTRLGYAVLNFGCLGGITVTTLFYQLLGQSSAAIFSGRSAVTLFFTTLVLLVTYFLATKLFPGRAPQIILLKPNDQRYLIVADANQMAQHQDIRHLFTYAEAVEVSPAVKNIVIS